MNNLEAPGVASPRERSFRPQDERQLMHSPALHTLVRLVTKRSKWIIGSILACGLLAAILSMRTKPIYDATATIELNKSNGAGSLGLGELFSQGLAADEDLLTDQQTETAILQSDSLALAVIQKLNLASQSPFLIKDGKGADLEAEKGLSLEEAPGTRTRLLAIFKAGLLVNPIRGTRLIKVTYESHDPKQAAEIANALIDSYKNQFLQSHYEATSEASNWLTKQLSDLKSNVEDSEKKLTDFEKETGIISLNMMPAGSGGGPSGEGQIHSVVIQKLDALNTELTAAEANRIEKEAIYRLVQTNNGDVVLGLAKDPMAVQSNSMVLNQGGGLSNLQQLRQQQHELKIGLAEASTTFGANNRHLKEMETQLRALDEQIDQELKEIVKRAQGDFQLAQQTEDVIRQRFQQQQAEAGKLNEKTVQFAVLSQEAYSRKRLYEDLYTKLQEANVSAGIKETNITIVDPARSQSTPVRPQPMHNLVIGMLFGILVGLGAAFTADSLDRTVGDPMEVELITGSPVIGVIPDFEEKARIYGIPFGEGRRLRLKRMSVTEESSVSTETQKASNTPKILMLAEPDSAAAEAFRALRTSVILSRAGGGSGVILVTSCMPGEGKTTVTTNLAVALAQYNKRVIIVDADMRRPRVAHSTPLTNEVGLSNVLANSCTIDEAVHRKVHVQTLDILPAGPRPPRPADILGSIAFAELLEHLKLRYDIVLIDSPPSLVVTDAVSISLMADSVIWVSQAGVVTRPDLARATRMIERDGMKVIGFVVNRIRRKDAGYGSEYAGSYYVESNPHGA